MSCLKNKNKKLQNEYCGKCIGRVGYRRSQKYSSYVQHIHRYMNIITHTYTCENVRNTKESVKTFT